MLPVVRRLRTTVPPSLATASPSSRREAGADSRVPEGRELVGRGAVGAVGIARAADGPFIRSNA
eukprot:scaffold280453_cov31-Tisochrysis_lutea.AAC.1